MQQFTLDNWLNIEKKDYNIKKYFYCLLNKVEKRYFDLIRISEFEEFNPKLKIPKDH